VSNKIKSKQIDIENLKESLNYSEIGHTHNQSEISNLTTDLEAKAPINNPTFTGTVTLPAVGDETNKTAATVGYVDAEIDKILGGEGLSENLDTIKEIQKAVTENQGIIETLQKVANNNTTYNLIGSNGAEGTETDPASISLYGSDETEDIIEFKGINGITVSSDSGGNIYIDGAKKVPTTRTVNGKSLSENITLSASDVGADASGSADTALANAKAYTDSVAAQKAQILIITWEEND